MNVAVAVQLARATRCAGGLEERWRAGTKVRRRVRGVGEHHRAQPAAPTKWTFLVMTNSTRAIAGLIAAATLACFCTPSYAQSAPPNPPQAADKGEAWRQFLQERIHERTEAAANRLRDILHLRPDQDASLRTLIKSLAPAPGAMHMADGNDRQSLAALTTPERLDRIAALMTQRQTNFQRRADAIKAFYAVLSPEQQQAFNALWPNNGGRRGAMWLLRARLRYELGA